MQSEQLSEQKLYAWGSSECDQFLAKDEDDEELYEVKRPYQIKELSNLSIVQVACGGMHALILTSQGKVYSFGCDDKGVLGRPQIEGQDARLPDLITDLPPVNMIACGSSHSIAANSHGLVYFWGFYANTHGPIGEAVSKPKKLDNITNGIKKILCGQNHTMVLLDNFKLLTWGDAETLVIGRKSETRRSVIQNLNPQPIKMKRPIIDIFTGASHAFVKVLLKDNKPGIYGWGLNNYGQLGIGNQENQQLPYLVEFFENMDIVDMVGGEHHTIALDCEGNVYSFGRNDDGQLGLGEQLNEMLRIEAEKQKVLEEELYQQQQVNKKKTSKKNKQGDLFEVQKSQKVIGYEFITTPQKINNIPKMQSIFGSMHFNFAISQQKQIFSWGNGQSYVLGTRNENSQFQPKDVTTIFKNEKLLQISLGASHVIALTSSDHTFELPMVDQQVLQINDPKSKLKKGRKSNSREMSKEKSISMKRSVQKFDDSIIPVKDLRID
ncbi:unnamed protein product [Paramecium pentaurelia]|uniref:RCC1-like domain-containing protein n=1 Tax=Paramecium pentaurelia TaxID=43138 RepID=A0A8S1S489_9CILI|nr:unnamed protein product [Paramecium pentaurelia]